MRLQRFFTITVIIAACGCGVSENDIRRYGREGNVDLLVRTIDKGYRKQKRHAKVKLAIEQTVKQDIEKAWNYLLYRFDHGFTDDLISHTLLAPSSTSNLNVLQKQFLQYIQESNLTEAQALEFIRTTWRLINSPEDLRFYAEAQALVSIAARIGIADEQIPPPVQEQLQIIINAQTRLDSLQDLQQEAKRSINSYQNQLDKAKELQGKYFLLQGYIVGQADIGFYEISYFGSRAYLQTTESRFESTGQFTRWAYELMEIPVTLRQEFGGFTQQWKVYREATSDQVSEMHEANKIISASEELIEYQQGIIESLEPVLSSHSEALDGALDQLTRLLKETFDYSNVGVD